MEGKHVVCEMVAQHELDHVMSWSKPCHVFVTVMFSHVFTVWHDLTWFGMSWPCAWLQRVMSEFVNFMLKRCHVS